MIIHMCVQQSAKIIGPMLHTRLLVIILVLILIQIVYSGKTVDDICTFKPKEFGICKLLHDCPEALENFQKKRIFPKICGFQDRLSIVCCPRKPGEVSKIKCQKYSSNVSAANESRKTECGHLLEELIVGGQSVRRKEFPHMVLLKSEIEDKFCGGIIISDQYILTAAHCFRLNEAYAVMGITNLNDTQEKQEIKVAEFITHPNYTSSRVYHDIALARLEKPANLSSYVKPACLYAKSEVTAKKAIATGWGSTSYGGPQSIEMLKAKLDLVNHEFCNASYFNKSRKLQNGIVDEWHICAGSESTDTCQGDSGGPLQIYHVGDDVKCMYDIIGVTSFGNICGYKSGGVYVRVSHYIKWIEDIVWS